MSIYFCKKSLTSFQQYLKNCRIDREIIQFLAFLIWEHIYVRNSLAGKRLLFKMTFLIMMLCFSGRFHKSFFFLSVSSFNTCNFYFYVIFTISTEELLFLKYLRNIFFLYYYKKKLLFLNVIIKELFLKEFFIRRYCKPSFMLNNSSNVKNYKVYTFGTL